VVTLLVGRQVEHLAVPVHNKSLLLIPKSFVAEPVAEENRW